MFVHPSPGNHAKEDEGKNEAQKHRADNVGIAWGPIGTATIQ